MPSRSLVARELADLLKVLAHPDRIRMIEELRAGEKDVSGIAATLDISSTRVSQHLALLRAHHLVEDHPAGRHHIYRLAQPALAEWLLDALEFVDVRKRMGEGQHIDAARRLWSANTPEPTT